MNFLIVISEDGTNLIVIEKLSDRLTILAREMINRIDHSTESCSQGLVSVSAGLDQIIQQRLGSKAMGFGAKIVKKEEQNIGDILRMVQPEDLIKFGLIPEFLGRLPVIATIDELTEASLIRILKEPKNALVKQFERLFEMEGVNLRFTDSALSAIASEALKRKSGARGLRAILETSMLDIMYEIPSCENVKECVIGEEVVLSKEEPIYLYEQKKKQA